MKRIYHIVLGVLFVGLPGCFSWNKEHSAVETVTPLNAEQTAQRVAKLYNELGPRIGVHLVEPNAVLTISGLRGNSVFLMNDPTDEEMIKLEKVNEENKKFGIKFNGLRNFEGKIARISIFNLKGLEYSSKLSKLPFIIPFDSSIDEKGYDIWFKEVMIKASEYFKDKNYISEDQLGHFMIGLLFGYPDQALLDAYYNADHSKLVSHSIPYSDYYKNPEPNFSYLPEHEDEESIVNIKKSWGTLLEEFYNSSWYKTIAKDSVFIQTMESEKKAHEDWFKRKR